MSLHVFDNKSQYGLEHGVLNLFGKIAIGATGAVGALVANQNQGIKSVVRNSAGNYTINFTQPYQRLLFMDFALINASGAPSAGTNVNMEIRADNTNTTTPSVTIEFVNSSGTAVELSSGAVLLVNPVLKYATV